MKKILVNDSHRTNGLSLTPGGSVVTVIYKNGDRRLYDKVKNVEAYVNSIKKDVTIIQVWCEEVLIWERRGN
jgi:predicted secreted protein